MQKHIGEQYTATITTVTGFGLFVTLNDLYIDGLVHIASLGQEYFDYDEKRQRLIGELGTTFGLGEPVLIQVAGVNMDLLQIDFALVKKLSDPKTVKPKASKSKTKAKTTTKTKKPATKK